MLCKRFGKNQTIISTHMDEVLKISGYTSDKASQLRFVYDKISINVRGLESLGVSSSQYGSLLSQLLCQNCRKKFAYKSLETPRDTSRICQIC